LHDQYKRSKSKQLLLDYCHFSPEAYIVLTYYIGYNFRNSSKMDTWREDLSHAQMCLTYSVSAADCLQKNVAVEEEFTKLGQQMGYTFTRK
jgi:hypothetical protein